MISGALGLSCYFLLLGKSGDSLGLLLKYSIFLILNSDLSRFALLLVRAEAGLLSRIMLLKGWGLFLPKFLSNLGFLAVLFRYLSLDFSPPS